MKDLNICLIEPEIPQNTGNIARTCAVTGAALHLIGPLGFEIDSAKLKRAGLDYWDMLDIRIYRGIGEFLSACGGEEMYFFSQKGKHCYTDLHYPRRVFLVFGKESCGLPDSLLTSRADRTVRIPMLSDRRCLNLSNSAAVAAYEVLRQRDFAGFRRQGSLSGE